MLATRMLLTWVMTATRARMAVARSARSTRRDSTAPFRDFGCGDVAAGQRGLGGLVGVQRVRFALEPASLPVRAHDFQDLDAFPGQDPGEFGTVAAGAFDAGGNDRAESGDELDDLPVAGTDGQEFLVGDVVCRFR